MPWLIAVRVVSLPATTSRMKNDPNSWAVSRSPSTSAFIMIEVMSSRGFCTRSSPSAWAYMNIPSATFIRSSKLVTYSGSPTPRMTLVQARIWASSSGGMPIISQMICNGIGAATSLDEVAGRGRGTVSMRRSMQSLALSFTYSSTLATSLGVNARETMLRSRKCFGSSIAIIDPKNSLSSAVMSPMLVPRPLQKSWGLRLTCQMSSCLVSAQ